MYIKTRKEDLLKSSNNAAKAISRNSVLPAQLCLRIDASQKNGILITGQSSICSIACKCDSDNEIEHPLSILVTASTFISALSKMQGTDVVLAISNDTAALKIICGTNHMLMPLFDIANWPERQVVTAPELHFETDLLNQYIKETAHALAPGTTYNEILESFYIEFDEFGNMRVSTLDGVRISMRGKLNGTKRSSILINGKLLENLIRFMSDHLLIEKQRNYVRLKDATCTVDITLTDGQFPRVEKMLTFAAKHYFTLETNAITDLAIAADLASILDEKNILICNFDKDTMHILTKGAAGISNSTIKCKNTMENMKLAINAKYLMDAIRSTGTDEAKLYVTSACHPIYMMNENYVEIILPVNIENV